MTIVYDEVRPFFSRKSSEAKQMLQTSTDEEPIILDLGVTEYEESIELLRDAIDDCVSSDNGLDSSDDEFSGEGDNVKGKSKIDRMLPSPSSRLGKRTRHSQSDDAIDHILSRLCVNSDSDLHELVKEKQGVAGADMVGASVGHLDVDEDVYIVGDSYVPRGVGRNDSASQPATDGVKNASESSAQSESNRKDSDSHSSGEAVKNHDESAAQSEGGEEVVRDDGELSAYSQQEKEEEDTSDDGESSAQTEAEDSDESSSHLDEEGEALESSGSSGADREEVVKDDVESSATPRADGDDLSQFTAVEWPSQRTGVETSNLEVIVDDVITDWSENPADAPNMHDPSLVEQHIDALLNLILSKVKRVPEKFADNWAVIETYLWGTLQGGQATYDVGALVPYVLGTYPKIRWEDVRRHFTTLARYIPSACKKSGLWTKRQPPAAALSDQWAVVSNEDTPQQTNSHDCGIIALKILECLCAGVLIHVIDPAKCGQYHNDYSAALFQLTKEIGDEA
ncbi:hypothetical protein C2S52_013702 [Perilla frutescens var. hirtella]|nr:hypothetical protein C2S52_013702 [Perilla frutescens var. hirtella]